ncbi:uncharacterized protein LOC112872935 [Panicum hallii]|uniref:uncharacterized protein LOC112872935 n=1 Tax=Panicum hallii TaxID=206008 RepID=UPI000DF4E147|nr:uncharacterized protein LOC112872935 [Panicum hallii]
MKNMLYCHIDDIERLQKVVADTEEQFANCLRQIKTLGEEKGQREKELEILREATQTLMDMVDPAEEGKADKQPLLERLRGAPERVVKFLTEAPITCVSHAFTFSTGRFRERRWRQSNPSRPPSPFRARAATRTPRFCAAPPPPCASPAGLPCRAASSLRALTCDPAPPVVAPPPLLALPLPPAIRRRLSCSTEQNRRRHFPVRFRPPRCIPAASKIGELKKLVGVGNICYCMCFWIFQGTMFSSRMKPGSTCSSKKNQFSQVLGWLAFQIDKLTYAALVEKFRVF